MHTVRWDITLKLWTVGCWISHGEIAEFDVVEAFVDKANAYAFCSYLNGGAKASFPD